MATVLRDEQHELLLPDDDTGFVFGTADTGYLTTSPPTVGGGDFRNGDVDRLREDGISFGEDFQSATTYTFEITALSAIDSPDPWGEVDDLVGAFRSQWRKKAYRSKSSQYAILRSRVRGRTRRCYGRPRPFSESPSSLIRRGAVPITAEFVLEDGCWYDDDLQVESRSLSSVGLEGGFTAPFSGPLTTVANPDSLLRGFTIAGTEPAWLFIVFTAGSSSMLNPKVKFRDGDDQLFEVGINGSVPAGQSVVVDSRPWVRAIYRTDGASVGGMLSASSPPLKLLQLDPGTYGYSVSSQDISGTGSIAVQYRHAYGRP